MELFFTHERLPLKSDVSKENFMQKNFDEFDTQMKEVIDKIADRDSKKTIYDKNIVVEHSQIDFQYMTLGKKLYWDTEKGKYVFDSQKLARRLI